LHLDTLISAPAASCKTGGAPASLLDGRVAASSAVISPPDVAAAAAPRFRRDIKLELKLYLRSVSWSEGDFRDRPRRRRRRGVPPPPPPAPRPWSAGESLGGGGGGDEAEGSRDRLLRFTRHFSLSRGGGPACPPALFHGIADLTAQIYTRAASFCRPIYLFIYLL